MASPLLSFNAATFYQLRGGETAAQWISPTIADERNLLGTSETDINILGYGSPEITFDAVAEDSAAYSGILAQNGRTGTLDIGDGEGARNCVMFVSNPRKYPGGDYVVSLRFKAI